MGYKHLPPLVLPEDPAILGYAAGIVDGEGYIGISTAFDVRKSRKLSHFVRLVIVNTDPRLPGWFADRFGGAIAVSHSGRKKRWKPRCSWAIHGERAEKFIEAIRPYLVIKGEQADIALEMRRIGRHRGGGSGHGPGPLLDDIVEQREHLKQKIHLLNKRGVA